MMKRPGAAAKQQARLEICKDAALMNLVADLKAMGVDILTELKHTKAMLLTRNRPRETR